MKPLQLIDIPIGIYLNDFTRRLPIKGTGQRRFIDLSGREFGDYTVQGLIGFIERWPAWIVKCKCGHIKVIRSNATTHLKKCHHLKIKPIKLPRKDRNTYITRGNTILSLTAWRKRLRISKQALSQRIAKCKSLGLDESFAVQENYHHKLKMLMNSISIDELNKIAEEF